MKANLSRLSEQYLAALRIHLEPGSKISRPAAAGLGRQAVALGLETLELARIHEQALTTLVAPGGTARTRERTLQRAKTFLAEAIAPIEQTHRPALVADDRMNQLNQTLRQRTAELTASTRHMQQGIIQHQAVEKALQKSGKHRTQLLAKSHRLQTHLRHLTHEILSAQEQERQTISHQLQDEIAQTLLGINVRLLTLKKAAKGNTANLKKEIASTQRQVIQSVRAINQFARELDLQSASGKRSVRHNALRRCGAELPASAGIANRIMKTKSKPERRQREITNAAGKETPSPPASVSFRVIAMAASAGGLKALSVILGGLPADFPAAIAIVMHLAPDHKSLLAEILDSRSHLEVKQAHTGDILCRSSVFVAPPNHHLFVAKGGRLELSSSAAEKVHYARPSAEPLFASVAEVYQQNAIAVVLTGGDGDGSFGVQIIKEKGGQVIAQDRPTSQDFSMPETSIKTGDVDFILPLNEIAPKLIELVGAGVRPSSGAAT